MEMYRECPIFKTFKMYRSTDNLKIGMQNHCGVLKSICKDFENLYFLVISGGSKFKFGQKL